MIRVLIVDLDLFVNGFLTRFDFIMLMVTGILSMMRYDTHTVREALDELQTSEHGLSVSEVTDRLREYGLNILELRGEPLWKRLVQPFANIFMLVLFIAASVSLWHHEVVDALIIMGIMLANAVIYYVQRFSTDRILRSLQQHNRLFATARRDDNVVTIDAATLVPGDIVILEEGEKVPADCRVVENASLRVDESQLTGESLPVEKQTAPVSSSSELYERASMLYQGSFIVGGHACAVVTGTGNNTEFGRLAALSVTTDDSVSPVQKRIDSLISLLVRVIGGIAVVAFILSLYRGMSVTEAVRYVLALSVSAVPESLPVAITVVLVLGMRRMAHKKALVKNTAAIETIGTVTVIASDKTGTLTKNQLTVQQVWSAVNDDVMFHRILSYAANIHVSKTQDPLDAAIERYVTVKHTSREDNPAVILPFDQQRAMSGNIYQVGTHYQLYVKGAPEHIAEACHLPKELEEEMNSKLHQFAGNGLRVIALAHATLTESASSFNDISAHVSYTFDGLIGVADVLRLEAPSAIKRARAAGIRVYMITGDHFETAFHIAHKLGIVERREEVFDSRRMQGVSDDELESIVETTRVFARVLPENKHRLLTILNKHHITAMTGDGVNDVPALVSAHVGLAMGSGTSIAKDAGDIILLDNNFRSIVEAVHEGRTVYANIKRMVAYLLSTNAGEVLVALGSLIAGIPVPIVPVQILWINLVTDTCMVIPIGLEPGERRNMLVPPKPANAPLFSRFFLSRIMLTAVTIMVLTLGIYNVFLLSHTLAYARTLTFQAIVVMQWASACNSRSDYESLLLRMKRFNPAFYIGLLIAICMQLLALTQFMHPILHLTDVKLGDTFIVTLIAFVVPIGVIEMHKWIGRRFFHKGSANQRCLSRVNVRA